ncbi:MAG: zf-TFIIB domain-containing protein [Burkholderiales bacterium]
MDTSVGCPSCRQPMAVHRFTSSLGVPFELELCFVCRGMWFDRHENLKLTPDAVVELFRLLHEHRADQHLPMSSRPTCPRCVQPLVKGFDLVRSGRYVTFRCTGQHGRFSSFSSFMVEKGFVRQMTRPEIDDLARRVGAIHCTGCGAPVDIRKDHACGYCGAAFSLIDPQAVVRALEGHATAGARAKAASVHASSTDIGDVLVSMAQDRGRAEREGRTGGLGVGESRGAVAGDLLTAGLALLWRVLDD